MNNGASAELYLRSFCPGATAATALNRGIHAGQARSAATTASVNSSLGPFGTDIPSTLKF